MKKIVIAVALSLGLVGWSNSATAHAPQRTSATHSHAVKFVWIWVPAQRTNGVRIAGHWKRVPVTTAPPARGNAQRHKARRNHRYHCGC